MHDYLCLRFSLCKCLRMQNTSPANEPPRVLIGSSEVCEILGIDRGSLVRRIAAGKIPVVSKLAGQTGAYVFDRAEIERIERAAAEAKAPAAP